MLYYWLISSKVKSVSVNTCGCVLFSFLVFLWYLQLGHRSLWSYVRCLKLKKSRINMLTRNFLLYADMYPNMTLICSRVAVAVIGTEVLLHETVTLLSVLPVFCDFHVEVNDFILHSSFIWEVIVLEKALNIKAQSHILTHSAPLLLSTLYCSSFSYCLTLTTPFCA